MLDRLGDGWGYVLAGFTTLFALRIVYAWVRPRVSPSQIAVRLNLRRAKLTQVDQIAEGLTQVSGVARARGSLITAPLSCRRCLGYQLVIERESWMRFGWKALLSESRLQAFRLEDATGSLEVRADHYRLGLAPDVWGDNSPLSLPRTDPALVRNLIQLIKARNLISDEPDWDRRLTLRFRESILEDGAAVSVLGTACREVRAAGERPSFREAPEILTLSGTTQEPLQLAE